MHRPRSRRQRNRDVESDGVMGTSLSNPQYGAQQQNASRRKLLAIAGAIILFVGVAAISIHSYTTGDFGDEEENFEVGHAAFSFDSKTNIEYVHADVQMLKHKATGMPVMAVIPQDESQDATFGISFRTPSEDNRGRAGIVEHMLQAGSETYPVKDPINQVKAGSLSTY